ncbi:MAG: M20/M25/M40 family metallo-hydrolase, partial [Phenylobacterium sp.]|uniref:M20/M25/M40 family metallo-hydrolase n=1 Tax=Phenylobacterium sp. TaxID=1871053 RepID=UPI001A42E61D
ATAKTPVDTGEAEFRALYKELVETNTTFSAGDCTLAAQRMADRLKAAGFADSQLTVFAPEGRPKDGGLVAVLPGKDPKAKAILLLAHIDVVEARREDWERDPFKLVEENGYFYGRGASDDKAQAAIWTDLLVRFKREGYQPRRGVKVALTCGEEGGGHVNGALWLAQNRRELIDAAFALNEGAGGGLDAAGKRVVHNIQAGEKRSVSYRLEVTNPGGHSSRPVPENAIYRLSRAIDRLSQHQFPVQLNDTTRAYFTRMSKVTGGETGAAMAAIVANPTDPAARAVLSRDANHNAILGTTCIPTMLSGGHAANALPQRATVTVNCRLFPGDTAAGIREALAQAVADPQVAVIAPPANPARSDVGAPPLTPQVLGPIEKVSQQMWPGVPVVPILQAGGTDAPALIAVGIPTYGVSGIFYEPDLGRIHGLNENIRVQSLMEGREFSYRLVKMYAEARD